MKFYGTIQKYIILISQNDPKTDRKFVFTGELNWVHTEYCI